MLNFFQASVRFGSVLFFCATLSAIIFFAEGYWYDAEAKDFVKQGLLFFEDVQPEGARLYVDGEELAFSGSGELRLLPGPHHVVFASEGFVSWEKNVSVPQDEVLRFKKLRLFPVSDAAAPIFTRKILAPVSDASEIFAMPHGLYLNNKKLHFWKVYNFDASGDFVISEDAASLSSPENFSFHMLSRPKNNFLWEFRMGDSENRLFLKEDKKLRYCDRDEENCREVAILDAPMLFASPDRTQFFGVQGGNLVMFDFREEAKFPRELFHRALQEVFGVAAVFVGVPL